MTLGALIERCESVPLHVPYGTVLDVVGLIVEIGGLKAAVGETLSIVASPTQSLDVEVVGFRGGRLLATPLGPLAGVRPGARVARRHRGPTVPVSD
ncbi:MAG TPA: hypothetical protein VLJ38_19545, partial [Polyangiaceae bacterium]|nr:hypothetical protein [Polyangiaceae bacterium]